MSHLIQWPQIIHVSHINLSKPCISLSYKSRKIKREKENQWWWPRIRSSGGLEMQLRSGHDKVTSVLSWVCSRLQLSTNTAVTLHCFKNLMPVFSSWAQAEPCRESVICSGDEKKFVVTKIFPWWLIYFFLAWNIFLVMEAIVRWLNEVFF